MKKTVVELDLVGYSTVCDNFEQGLDVNSAAQLNQQIQSFVDIGLNAVNASREQHVMQTTGDGAILVFDGAADAHRFAQAVHEATLEHNRTRGRPLAKRVFRIGAATGDIVMQPKSGGGFEIAGMTIARAVRLEAKAQPGGLLVDEVTFGSLTADQRERYGPKQIIAGKRDEEFEAYACQLNADGPEDAAFYAQGAGAFHADISRIIKYAPAELVGRGDETKLLNDAWIKVRTATSPRPHVLTFVALGGEGKTSLVAKWVADLAHQDWPGCDAVFAWSFYSQGTREQTAVSSDLFLKEALTFFGDAEMAGSTRGAFDKGRRLAQLVGKQRALLLLDGLEPLQYAPTSPTPGELKDDGIAALLKGLAATSRGLCVVTTRYSIPNLKAFWQSTSPEHELKRLSTEAGVNLLQKLGVRKESGTQKEFEKLVEDVKGHALTLNLLGSYLHEAHAGDIRKRDLVKLEEADAEEQGGHAFRVMDAYVRWFETDGEKGERALAILRVLGLFDRPATDDCLAALQKAPFIPGLTDALVGMSEAQRNIAFNRLKTARLLTVNRESGSGVLITLDAHPLLREYFALHVRQQQPESWRAAHRRLYEHLKDSTKEFPDTLEGMQPLYQAVAHACHAGMQQEACEKVYRDRIQRGTTLSDGFYSLRMLGAAASNLGAIGCFFEQPWNRLSPLIRGPAEGWLLNEAASHLRSLGRLVEARDIWRAALEKEVNNQQWELRAGLATNLSEIQLTLGEVAAAERDAERSMIYADRGDDWFFKMVSRTTLADCQHQAGRQAEAKLGFREAEAIQAAQQGQFHLLFSGPGYRYSGLLLAEIERSAWQVILTSSGVSDHDVPFDSGWIDLAEKASVLRFGDVLSDCRDVFDRAVRTLQMEELLPNAPILDVALHRLNVSRIALYMSILEARSSRLSMATSYIVNSVDGLGRADARHHLPSALLTRSWLRFLSGTPAGPESAQSDLDEAWEIAERGPMRLFMADIHLYRARLFFREKTYPWKSPQDDLAAAEKLINECGYHRRDEDLADAKLAIRGG